MSSPATPARDACYQWLLAGCRAWLHRQAGQLANIPWAIPLNLDWPTLEAMARYQGVEPILHALVSNEPSVGCTLPDRLKETWERAYYGTRIRNSEALSLITELSRRCHEAGVHLLVIKGAAIAADVYRDVGLRPMADLDVLCRRRDLLAFRDIVTSLGFSAGTPYLHEIEFYCDERNVLLEAHFNLHHFVRHKDLFLESAWRDSTRASIEDWTFPVLSLEHQIVFELGHGVWHRFELDLKHLLDFAGRLFLRSGVLDRARLATLLDQTGLTGAYSLLAGSLGRVFDLPLDESPSARPASDRRASFDRQLLERSSALGFVRASVTGSEFLGQRGFARKAVFAWKRLIPPLAALQAAYNLRTPMQAVLWIPVHVGRALLGLYSRARSGV